MKRIGKGWPKPFATANVEDMESLAKASALVG
jgi:hypothetical protein